MFFEKYKFFSRAAKCLSKTAFCCGIVAYVGPDPAKPYLLEGLNILRNRGYDSAGISTISSSSDCKKIKTTKCASTTTSNSLDILKEKMGRKHDNDFCGIAHTRWATHGSKTDENAHPQIDQNNKISLVHNGTIENAYILKKKLLEKGVVFKSETDTEVIVQYIGYFYNLEKNIKNMDQLIFSVNETIKKLEGTFGLAIICSDFPENIILVRNGSPLAVGFGENRTWVASEYSAFSRFTKNYAFIGDNEIIIVSKGHVLPEKNLKICQIPDENIDHSPHPFPHWTLKEINEQPEAINRSLNNGARIGIGSKIILGGLERKQEMLKNIKHLVICACGSSNFAALFILRIMRNIKSFKTVQVLSANEFDINILIKKSALLVISQSGETRDVIKVVKKATEIGVYIIGIVNAVGSQIAVMTNFGVYTNAGREFGVASTKGFITQVTCLVLLSVWFANLHSNPLVENKTNSLVKDLQRLSGCAKIALNQNKNCLEIAKKILQKEHIFVLGKGCAHAIANEAALKIKEISYIHAEGYSMGELKHGPFALIENGTPIFIIFLKGKSENLVRVTCQEVLARGAELFIVTDCKEKLEGINHSGCLEIPHNGALTPLLAVIPFQFLAYHLAVLRNLDPDKPRNLAKAVTVD